MATKKKTKLAIFDIDGTIFRSSLSNVLIKELVRSRIFPDSAKKEVETDYLAWIHRQGSYENYDKQVINILLKYIHGCKKKDIDAAVQRAISKYQDRVYRFTRDLVRDLKKRGYYLLTISTSIMDMVAPFAEHLGFDAHFGTIYEVKDGKYTNTILNIENLTKKKQVIENFVLEAGLNVDWKRSVAVGDTQNDISMLSMVGNPIAFNPNKGLAEYAKKKKWPIIVERKDVIYEISSFKFRKF